MLKIAISPIVISFAVASMFAGPSASAQQVSQPATPSITGTVVRVRLLAAQVPEGNHDVRGAHAQDLVEVGVRVSDGDVYSVTADRWHQPHLGASVVLVSDGGGFRIAE